MAVAEVRGQLRAAKPYILKATSLEAEKVREAIGAITKVLPEVVRWVDLSGDVASDPLVACGTHTCGDFGGPGGSDPCVQTSDCPSETSCVTHACDTQACTDHTCATHSCAGESCAEHWCVNNSCAGEECSEHTSPGPEPPECRTHECEEHACDNLSCGEQSCGTYTTSDDTPASARSTAVHAETWGLIVEAVAGAGSLGMDRARALQITKSAAGPASER